jgi:hypothetical protein
MFLIGFFMELLSSARALSAASRWVSDPTHNYSNKKSIAEVSESN